MGEGLRVAVVGAGPAGIYAADRLVKDVPGVRVDLLERLPAPFGLIRYGVAPDHPRIKGIVGALHRVLAQPQVRLVGNVEYGVDVDLEMLRRHYDAVVFATGAVRDRPLRVRGGDLPGSYSSAEFVSWYDGHPDGPRSWPLHADKVAVIGMGNVALDAARMLAKSADELAHTEIPDHVYDGLAANAASEIHVFGRRGPAQAKFSPLELRELDESPTIDVVVDPGDMVYDEASVAARAASKITDQVAGLIEEYAARGSRGRARKLVLHFFEEPVEILSEDGAVVGLRAERTELDGTGNAKGTGRFTEWPVQAVYRAIGYLSDELPGLPFDHRRGVVPNEAGRVEQMTGVYVTGWVRRGPVGLIGHTRSDSAEVVAALIADHRAGLLPHRPGGDLVETLDRAAHPYTTWDGWQRLDAHERSLGAQRGRERTKVVERADMLAASRALP